MTFDDVGWIPAQELAQNYLLRLALLNYARQATRKGATRSRAGKGHGPEGMGRTVPMNAANDSMIDCSVFCDP